MTLNSSYIALDWSIYIFVYVNNNIDLLNFSVT